MRPWFHVIAGLVTLMSASHLLAADGGDDSDQDGNIQVDVIVDMFDAGRKVAPPTLDKPVYYLPVPEGYKAFGYAPYFQRPPPTAIEVERFIEHEFAAQGYRVMVKGSRPTLVLDLLWGYASPTNEFSGGRGGGSLSGMPPGLMETLIYGAKGLHDSHTADYDGRPRNYRMDDELKQMGAHGRYFVIVSAYDFQDFLRRKATLLWCAHISTELWGHYFDQVLPTLVATAAPLLGHEMTRPELVAAPVVPNGRVVVGAPYLKAYPPAPKTP